MVWWPIQSPEPSQRNSGTISSSAEHQQNSSTVPIHPEASKASPGHAGCYTVSLLELPAKNIQRYLKMNRKLVVVGVPTVCSDVHLLPTSLSYYPTGAAVLQGRANKNWLLPVLTLLLFHREGTQVRYWYTHRFCWDQKSPIRRAYSLKDWMHMGQHILKNLCNG